VDELKATAEEDAFLENNTKQKAAGIFGLEGFVLLKTRLEVRPYF